MSDPDRDALRKALEASNGIQGPTWTLIMDAARRDLARLEREAPKKSMLMQMVEWLETKEAPKKSMLMKMVEWLENCEREVDERYNMDLQAAAVLRAVEKLKRANEITGTPSRERVEEFLRSLP